MLNFSTKGPKAAGSQANLRSLLRSRDFGANPWDFFSGKSSPETHGISHGLRWAFPTDVHPKCPTSWLDPQGDQFTGEENCSLCHRNNKVRLCLSMYRMLYAGSLLVVRYSKYVQIQHISTHLSSSFIDPSTYACYISLCMYICIYIRICIDIAYPKQLAAHVGNETALQQQAGNSKEHVFSMN